LAYAEMLREKNTVLWLKSSSSEQSFVSVATSHVATTWPSNI